MKVIARAGLGTLLILLTAWGTWKIVRWEPSLVILVLIIATITLTCGFLTAAEIRYRLPAEPYIILIILYGLRKRPGHEDTHSPKTVPASGVIGNFPALKDEGKIKIDGNLDKGAWEKRSGEFRGM
jgi:hypothetical protein